MVGLPARGKTYIARKLAYYLNWVQVPAKGIHTTEPYMPCDNKNNMSLKYYLSVNCDNDTLLILTMTSFQPGGVP